MLNNKQLPVLRELVLKKFFSPSNSDRQKWLRFYHDTIHTLLETDEFDLLKISQNKVEFNSRLIPLEFEVALLNDSYRFNATLKYDDCVFWEHHVDEGFKTQFLDEALNKQYKHVIGEADSEDIKKVLDDLIFHPEVHQHFNYPELDHRIRIGGGITNVFQFLVHLRFQLILDDQKREEEGKRLAKVVKDHFVSSKKNYPISSADFFKQ